MEDILPSFIAMVIQKDPRHDLLVSAVYFTPCRPSNINLFTTFSSSCITLEFKWSEKLYKEFLFYSYNLSERGRKSHRH